jgi:hypothetical protein
MAENPALPHQDHHTAPATGRLTDRAMAHRISPAMAHRTIHIQSTTDHHPMTPPTGIHQLTVPPPVAIQAGLSLR